MIIENVQLKRSQRILSWLTRVLNLSTDRILPESGLLNPVLFVFFLTFVEIMSSNIQDGIFFDNSYAGPHPLPGVNYY